MPVSVARFPGKSSVPALALEYSRRRILHPFFTSTAKPAGKSAPLGCRSFFGFVFFHSHIRSGFCSAGKHLFSAKMQMEGFTGSGCICHPRRNHDGSGLAIPLGCAAPKCFAQPTIFACKFPWEREGKFNGVEYAPSSLPHAPILPVLLAFQTPELTLDPVFLSDYFRLQWESRRNRLIGASG